MSLFNLLSPSVEARETETWSASHVAWSHALSSDRGTGGGVYDPVSNATFLTWAGPGMDPTVVEFNHTSGTYRTGPRPAGDGRAVLNHHNYPKMVMADDGTLLVVWTDHNRALYMSRCSLPRTVVCDWTETMINDDRGTYPTVHKSSEGYLYIFYRHTAGEPTDHRPLRYVKSYDGGRTWSDPVKAIDTSDLMPGNLNEVYSDGLRHEPAHDDVPERFLLGWTMAGGGPVHEHNVYRKDVYFAHFYPGTDSFASADGTVVGKSIDFRDMERCLVVDSGPLDEDDPQRVDYYFAPSYQDVTGHPVLLYSLGGNLESAVWTGTRWERSIVSIGVAGLLDIEKMDSGPSSFRAYHLEGGGVQVHYTVNGGLIWEKSALIAPPPGGGGRKFNKMFKIPSNHPDIEMLVLENDWKDRSYAGTYGVWTIGNRALPPAPSLAPTMTALAAPCRLLVFVLVALHVF